MSILEDMVAEARAQDKLPPGATWLVGGNVWHALMADLALYNQRHGIPALDITQPPEILFGASVRHIRRMTGWTLAEPLDVELAAPQSATAPEGGVGVDAR